MHTKSKSPSTQIGLVDGFYHADNGVMTSDRSPNYLPVAKVAKALMTGFREGFSYKVFDSGANGKKRD